MRYVIGIFAGFILLVAGYSAYWVWLAQGFEDGIEQWVTMQKARGYAIEHGSIEIGGYPFSLDGHISSPRIGRPDHPQAWDWRGEILRFNAAPWRPDKLDLDFAGNHILSYAHDGERRTVNAKTETGTSELSFSSTGLTYADARLSSVNILVSGQQEMLHVEKLRASARPQEQGAEENTEINLIANGVDLPANAAGPMGSRLSLFSLSGTVRGKLPAALKKEAVARWRDGGGVVDVHQLVLDWGKLASKSRGTLTLDTVMRPVGSLTSQIMGFRSVVDALVETRQIEAQNAGTIKAVLGILAKADSRGREVLSVPITAQNGRLAIGPFPVLALEPIL